MQQKFDKFIELLLKYNKTHSLTNFTTRESISKNIEDSLFPFGEFTNKKKVLDVGSGAGFPAIPLAIKYPNIEFSMCEPIQKKSSFLLLAKTMLQLNNVKVYTNKVEELSGEYDMIISRAVAKTSILLKITKHLLNKDLIYLFYKGEGAYDEIENIDARIIENGLVRYIVI